MVMTTGAQTYAPEAYSPTGVAWWLLDKHPGTNKGYGDVRKIAAWLAFNVNIGNTFTMRDLREVLGDAYGKPNAKEHLNRRLRELRPDGWVVFSYRDDRSLPLDGYRLRRIGWHPGLGTDRPPAVRVSGRLRRQVLDRDGRRCVVCGIGPAEPYPGEPESLARLTVGHRVPVGRARRAVSADELQTECQRCNEPVRDEAPDPQTVAEVLAQVRGLSRRDRDMLLEWLSQGRRLRTRLDEVHDRVRALTPRERTVIINELCGHVGH